MTFFPLNVYGININKKLHLNYILADIRLL